MTSTGDMSPEAQAIQEMIREEQGPELSWPEAASILLNSDGLDWETIVDAKFRFETEAPYCCNDEQAPILGVLGNVVHHQCRYCGMQLTTGGDDA